MFYTVRYYYFCNIATVNKYVHHSYNRITVDFFRNNRLSRFTEITIKKHRFI